MILQHSMGVCPLAEPPLPPPQLSYGGTLRLTFLLFLIKEGFSLGNLGEMLHTTPTTAVRQATREIGGPAGGLYWTANAMWVKLKPQCTEAFLSTFGFLPFFFPLDNSGLPFFFPVRFGSELDTFQPVTCK
jgi:hypothetical protein